MTQYGFSCVDAILSTFVPVANGKIIAFLGDIREKLCQSNYCRYKWHRFGVEEYCIVSISNCSLHLKLCCIEGLVRML
jgi:hypothetical protein